MKTISKDNYETFVIDYIDNKLNPSLQEEFAAFILANPTIAEQIKDLTKTIIKPANIVFSEKYLLKKITGTSVNPKDIDIWCLHAMECLLSAKQNVAWAGYLKNNTAAEKTFSQYSKTKVLANTNIIFPDKISLNKFVKKKGNAFYLYTSLAVAASFFVAFLILNTRKTNSYRIENTANILSAESLTKDTVKKENTLEKEMVVLAKVPTIINVKVISKKNSIIKKDACEIGIENIQKEISGFCCEDSFKNDIRNISDKLPENTTIISEEEASETTYKVQATKIFLECSLVPGLPIPDGKSSRRERKKVVGWVVAEVDINTASDANKNEGNTEINSVEVEQH